MISRPPNLKRAEDEAERDEDPTSSDAEGRAASAAEATAERQPVVNLPKVVLAAIALCALIHLVRVQFLNADQDFLVLIRTAFIPALYAGSYEWDAYSFTAPVTYSLLHGDAVHLGINMIWLAAFGSPLATRVGPARFVAFWVVSAGLSALLFLALNWGLEAPLVGASGAISAMMGAAARFGFRVDRGTAASRFSGLPMSVAETLQSRSVLTFLVIWMVVNFATGFLGAPGVEGQIAWEAHLGGFLVGFLGLGAFLRRADAANEMPRP